MGEAIIQGVLLGLLLSVLIGPVFFLLIRTSIERGVKAALILDIGVLLGDAFCIWISYIGLAAVFKNPYYAKLLGVIGAIILITVGLMPLLRRKVETREIELKLKKDNYFFLIFKGFILNITNPFVIFFWVASIGYAVTTFNNDISLTMLYFISCLFSYMVIDIIKIYLAVLIRNRLTTRKIELVNMFASMGVVLLGIVMLVRVIRL